MAPGRILTMSSWNTTTSPSTGVPLTSVAWYACTIKIVSSFLWLMEIWKCREDNVSLIIKSGIKVVQNSADWNSVPTLICALENGASNLPTVGGKVFISHPASTTFREKGGGKACALTTTTSSTMGSKTSSTNQPKLVKWKGAVPMRGDTGKNGKLIILMGVVPFTFTGNYVVELGGLISSVKKDFLWTCHGKRSKVNHQ